MKERVIVDEHEEFKLVNILAAVVPDRDLEGRFLAVVQLRKSDLRVQNA
ncbi:MAG: hypothetical protein HXY34_00995 [Candidatus Thorarchaeota archaeon]|nr:hypothetical protein [Candidatus Thorarchaeota archaeon]